MRKRRQLSTLRNIPSWCSIWYKIKLKADRSEENKSEGKEVKSDVKKSEEKEEVKSGARPLLLQIRNSSEEATTTKFQLCPSATELLPTDPSSSSTIKAAMPATRITTFWLQISSKVTFNVSTTQEGRNEPYNDSIHYHFSLITKIYRQPIDRSADGRRLLKNDRFLGVFLVWKCPQKHRHFGTCMFLFRGTRPSQITLNIHLYWQIWVSQFRVSFHCSSHLRTKLLTKSNIFRIRWSNRQ